MIWHGNEVRINIHVVGSVEEVLGFDNFSAEINKVENVKEKNREGEGERKV